MYYLATVVHNFGVSTPQNSLHSDHSVQVHPELSIQVYPGLRVQVHHKLQLRMERVRQLHVHVDEQLWVKQHLEGAGLHDVVELQVEINLTTVNIGCTIQKCGIYSFLLLYEEIVIIFTKKSLYIMEPFPVEIYHIASAVRLGLKG